MDWQHCQSTASMRCTPSRSKNIVVAIPFVLSPKCQTETGHDGPSLPLNSVVAGPPNSTPVSQLNCTASCKPVYPALLRHVMLLCPARRVSPFHAAPWFDRAVEGGSQPHTDAQHTPAKRSKQEPAAGQPQPQLKPTPRSASQLHLSLPPKLLSSRSTAQPFTPAATSLQAGRLRELAAAQTPYHSRPGSAAVQAAYAAGASDRGSPQIPAHRYAHASEVGCMG